MLIFIFKRDDGDLCIDYCEEENVKEYFKNSNELPVFTLKGDNIKIMDIDIKFEARR